MQLKLKLKLFSFEFQKPKREKKSVRMEGKGRTVSHEERMSIYQLLIKNSSKGGKLNRGALAKVAEECNCYVATISRIWKAGGKAQCKKKVHFDPKIGIIQTSKKKSNSLSSLKQMSSETGIPIATLQAVLNVEG